MRPASEVSKLLNIMSPEQFHQLMCEAEKRGLISRRPELTVSQLVHRAHSNARLKGFWEDWEFVEEQGSEHLRISAINTRLLLIVSEVCEALDALRRGDQAGFREELADVAIRLGDLCGGLEIELDAECRRKMVMNEGRPYKHGKKF